MGVDQERESVAGELERRAKQSRADAIQTRREESLMSKQGSQIVRGVADQMERDAELDERAASLLRGDGLGRELERLVRHPRFESMLRCWDRECCEHEWNFMLEGGDFEEGEEINAHRGAPTLEAAVAAALAVLDSEGEPEEEKEKRQSGSCAPTPRPEEYR